MNPLYFLVAERAYHRCEYCHAPESIFNAVLYDLSIYILLGVPCPKAISLQSLTQRQFHWLASLMP
jgi:hypothetical protein